MPADDDLERSSAHSFDERDDGCTRNLQRVEVVIKCGSAYGMSSPNNFDPWHVAMVASFVFLLAHFVSSFLLSPSVPWLTSQGKIDATEKSCTGIFKENVECDRSELWRCLRSLILREDLREELKGNCGFYA